MAFVKLDCGMLDSTTWHDKPARDVFLTALLMARPKTFGEDAPQLRADSLDVTGFVVPAGEYGFVAASGPGIIHRAGLSLVDGMEALARLGAPEPESRSQEHGGRRLVRVNGGYVVLNFRRFHDKDHTAAERQRRFKERHRDTGNGVTTPEVTQGRGKRVEGRGNTRERGGHEPAPAAPPPSLSEVASLWTEEGLPGSPERFWYHWEARGWKGIVKWEAEARKWTANERPDPGAAPVSDWGKDRPAEADREV